MNSANASETDFEHIDSIKSFGGFIAESNEFRLQVVFYTIDKI